MVYQPDPVTCDAMPDLGEREEYPTSPRHSPSSIRKLQAGSAAHPGQSHLQPGEAGNRLPRPLHPFFLKIFALRG
ncbi:MAG: hypothetical protein H7836_10945, partial [Magnetococcus sp. YQC-3]